MAIRKRNKKAGGNPRKKRKRGGEEIKAEKLENEEI